MKPALRPDIGHTETAPDLANQEKHRYRLRKIQELARPAYSSYKKLFEASSNVRYLASGKDKVAADFYTIDDARRLVLADLQKVRDELEKAFRVNLK